MYEIERPRRGMVPTEAAAFYLRKVGDARRAAFVAKGVALDRGALGAAAVLVEFARLAREGR